MFFHILFLNQSSRKIEGKTNAKEGERMRLQTKLKVKVLFLVPQCFFRNDWHLSLSAYINSVLDMIFKR